MNDDQARAGRSARRYRDLGLSPIPSVASGTKKKPVFESYSHYRAEPLEGFYYANWPTANVQLFTGFAAPGPMKIIVVDCDGEPAISRFEGFCRERGFAVEETWRVVTGTGGMHFYFAYWQSKPCPSGMIWGLWDTYGANGKGGWVKHQEVRILGDGVLVVAPPSVHLVTGVRYQFHGLKPDKGTPPLDAPEWLLEMPRLTAPRFSTGREIVVPTLELVKPSTSPRKRFPSRNEVLAAVPDKIAVAASWGLRIASQPNASGWASCYCDPDDRSASGMIDSATGSFQDRRTMETISLFDLGVKLGRFSDWRDARDWCGQTYGLASSPYAQVRELALASSRGGECGRVEKTGGCDAGADAGRGTREEG